MSVSIPRRYQLMRTRYASHKPIAQIWDALARVAPWTSFPEGCWRVTMPLPTRPGHVHCYLLPVDGGFMLVDTGLGLPDAAEQWAAELARLDGSGRHDLPDPLPPRPPRRRRRRPRADGRPGRPGPSRRRAGRARLAERRVVGCPRGLVPPTRRSRGSHGRADRAGTAVPAVHQDGHGSRARRRRRPSPRVGDRRRAGPCGRPADAAQGRRPDRRRPPARPDHADRRALACEPPGSARGLSRRAASGRSTSLPRSPTAGTATPIADPVGTGARADRAPRRAPAPGCRRARAEAAHRLRGVVSPLR